VYNERLEFLGDAVLGVIVAEYLYKSERRFPEGEMTKLRADMVCEKSLSAVAAKIGLGDQLLLGKGEEMGGGRMRPSILADATEALLAAIFLDGGREYAEKFVYKFIIDEFEHGFVACGKDYKTRLQELVQKKSGQVLSYRPAGESGPDHAKIFTVEAMLNGEVISSGSGKSKKEAEQMAAKAALETLG